MGVFSEKGDCDMMGKSKGSVKGVLTCYLESSMRELQDQYATVNLLVVTDNQFYQDQDNWKTVAQDIVAEANWQFDRDDIRVALCVMAYTDSRRVQLSNQPDILSNPVAAFERVYPNSDLDLWASDLALYLGGYNADGPAQGATYGYYPDHHRHAWAQMVEIGRASCRERV